MGLLVLPYQSLPFVARRVLGLIEGRSIRHDPTRIGGPSMSKVAGFPRRACLVSSRTRFAVSTFSRQSGSMPGGGGSAGEELPAGRVVAWPVFESDILGALLR